jgi:nucleotide-binding universal stress UspA family protein
MYDDILLTIDLGDRGSQERAIATAVEYAKVFDATLHVLAVVPDFGMSIVAGYFPKDYEKKVLEETRRELHAFTQTRIPAELRCQHLVGHGTIYKEILAWADRVHADLIIMSSHRPELADYLLGPNAARVVRHAKISVLVVRPPNP